MDGSHTAAQLRSFAAGARYYRLEQLLWSRRPCVYRLKDFDALRRAARKVIKAEAEAPELGRDMNPFIMMVRHELQQSD